MESKNASEFNPHKIVWEDEKISRLWDYYSKTSPFSDVYFSKVFGSQLLQHCDLPHNKELEVLDFGCGPGYIWEHLETIGSRWKYTGLDFSRDSVRRIKEKGEGKSNFVGAEYVNALPVELSSSTYDAVLLFEVVEHLTDEHLDRSLAEIARLLKVGGVLVISTPNEEDLSRSTKFCPDCGAIFHEWQHVRNWSMGELQMRLGLHGFKLRKGKTLDFNAQGWGLRGILKRAMWIGRKFFNARQGFPHMIAVFQKD